MPRSQRGYSLSEENTPFETPRERRGESPLDPRIAGLGLEELHALRNQVPAKCCCKTIWSTPTTRCRSACVSLALRNFRLLRILSALQVPTKAALLRSPRLLAPSVECGRTALAAARTTENACTVDRRKLGCTCTRLAERQRMQEAEANRIAEPMAASAAMPPRRALPLPRRRTPSSCKPAMKIFSGWVKGRDISF